MALSRSEIVSKLNQVPTFAVVNSERQLMPVLLPTLSAGEGGEGGEEEVVAWFTDPSDAKGALALAKLRHPGVQLQLGVTHLGSAFALAAGWTPSNSAHPLRLQPSQLLQSSFKDTLMTQLQAMRIEQTSWIMPIFSCEELQSSSMLPVFLSRADLAATWVAAGRSKETLPDTVTVVDLRVLVERMMTDSFDWSKVRLIASESAIELAQGAKQVSTNADPLDEPPPLQ
ncbi:MAG: hypothetical protein SGPRY_014663 [Prymnesium sp.]